MKAIILVGGQGQRLSPTTEMVNKHLMPVGGKPMFYYSLANAILAGCTDICFVGDSRTLDKINRHLGRTLMNTVLNFSFVTQVGFGGIVDALECAAEIYGGHDILLCLGDNVFIAESLASKLQSLAGFNGGCAYSVLRHDASQVGVLARDPLGNPLQVVEKPVAHVGHDVVVGLYKFPPDWSVVSRLVRPSSRGEREITSMLNIYLERGEMRIESFGRAAIWADCGTLDGLESAEAALRAVRLSGFDVGMPEEAMVKSGLVSCRDTLESICELPGEYYKTLTRSLELYD